MSGVALRNVTKSFNKTVVVKNVNLEIAQGEFVVLVGPSGCGKSTTLRMVAGLEEPTSGQIFIGGRDVTRLEPKDRDIAMVFQDYALYPHMTVEENMAFGLKLRKKSKQEIRQRIAKAAGILHIDHLLKRYPRELSGGQRQRVALGRAIVREPQVFLMDEPLSNLDAKLRVQMRAEIVKLQRQLNTTTIYVTHDQVEAMTMGDRIVVMKDGVVQQVGTPQEIYNQPANRFVAGFLGSPGMNFMDGELITSGGRLEFQAPGIRLPLPGKKVTAPAGRQKVVLGIRPENISLVPRPGDGWSNGISGRVELIEDLGAERIVFLTVGGQEIRVKVTDLAHMDNLQDQATLYFNLERTYLFSAGDGERLDVIN